MKIKPEQEVKELVANKKPDEVEKSESEVEENKSKEEKKKIEGDKLANRELKQNR